MRTLSRRTLDRLEKGDTYKNGRVKTWKDPVTGRKFSDWQVRTENAGGINPRALAKARKNPTLKAVEKRARARTDKLDRPVNFHLAAAAWARSHDKTTPQAIQSVEFWQDVDRSLIPWWQGQVETDEILLLFELDDPREIFWYH